MSYTTFDRYGGFTSTYAHARGGHFAGNGNSYWPDNGPGASDFSQQNKSHPSESIHERIFLPKKWSSAVKSPSAPEPLATQFRHPVPAREATWHKSNPTLEAKAQAHDVTKRQEALRRYIQQKKNIDAYLGDAPIHGPASSSSSETALRSWSDGALPSISSTHASSVSRETYEKHGFLVGRHRGTFADGKNGIIPRRHKPLSFHAMIFKGDLVGDGSKGKQSRRSSPQKPSKQWQTCPSNSFMLDPQTFLPVHKSSWDSKQSTSGQGSDMATLPKYASRASFNDEKRAPLGMSSSGLSLEAGLST